MPGTLLKPLHGRQVIPLSASGTPQFFKCQMELVNLKSFQTLSK